jgi:hypothetical protein
MTTTAEFFCGWAIGESGFWRSQGGGARDPGFLEM